MRLFKLAALAALTLSAPALAETQARLYEGNVESDNVITTAAATPIDLNGAEMFSIQAVIDVNTPAAGAFTAAVTDILTDTAHGYTTGLKGQASTTTTLPAGISLTTDYFVYVIDADTYKLSDTLAHALAGTNFLDVTNTGTGVHTFTPTALAGGTVKIEKSNDKSNWTDVAAATSVTADATVWFEVDRPKYRWVRLSYTLTAGRMSSDNYVLVKGSD